MTYRDVACRTCLWRDYYACDSTRPSYPPRCPECGDECTHDFFDADFTFAERNGLGRDDGIRSVFGDPKQGYLNLRDRRRTRNYPVAGYA